MVDVVCIHAILRYDDKIESNPKTRYQIRTIEMVGNPMQYNLSTIAIIRQKKKEREKNATGWRGTDKRENKTIDTREKKTTVQTETDGT